MSCPNCTNSSCPGPEELRDFTDWADLSSHASEETLVKWVNQLAEVLEARRFYGKKYRLRQQTLAKLAMRHLDPDEIEEIERRVKTKAAE